MTKEYTDIEQLKKLDFDDLAKIIADEAKGSYFGSKEPTDEEKKQLGKEIFKDLLETLRPHLCKKSNIGRLIKSDTATLMTSISDLVLTMYGVLPIAVVAVMILKYGLKRVCNDEK